MALLLSKIEIDDLILIANPLSSDTDLEQYNHVLQFFPKNPLYNSELITFGKGANEELMYFVLMENEKPVVMMPFFFRQIFFNDTDTGFNDVSSPYGYSGPIFAKGIDPQDIAPQFWAQVDAWYRKNKVVSEFIRFNMQENWQGYNGMTKPTLVNVRGKVLPEEQQWNNFKPKVRNNYRKSVSYNLTSTIYHQNITEEIIREFHKIYTGTMERNQASQQYFYELDYFTDLITNNPATCAIIIIYKEDIPISTELLLLSDTTINSFLGGTVVDYFHCRPNDFLKIEVLKWAREKGYTYYFLGGGRENNDSLYQYKKNFFPLDEDPIFYTGRKIVDREIYQQLIQLSPYCADCTLVDFFPLYRCKQTF